MKTKAIVRFLGATLGLLILTDMASPQSVPVVTVTVSPANVQVVAGQSVNVTLQANIPAPVLGWGLSLMFDASVLSLSNASLGPSWHSAGSSGLAGLAFPTPVSGSNILLASLTFQGIKSGSTSVNAAFNPSDLSQGFVLASGGFTGINGAVSLNPGIASFSTLLKYAVYATSGTCAAINLSGSGFTDSFDSSRGSYSATKQNTRGNVATNGNVSLSGSAAINGTISALNTQAGNCMGGAPGISVSGNAKATEGFVQLTTAPLFVNPASVTPGTQDVTLTSKKSSMTLSPGNYGNVQVAGGATLTLAPGTYNINSMILVGHSVLTVSPGGQVIIDVAGNKVSNALDFSGGTMSNPSGLAANFEVIYGGTLPIILSGGTNSFGLVYAPNSPVTLTGGADWFGALAVATLDLSGGGAIHYDRALAP